MPSASMSPAENHEFSINAPLGGWLLPLDEVDDPVFAGRVLGEGFAIDPVESVLTAPFDGVVTSIHRACHAVTMRSLHGVEVLMHIGLDTVAFKGEGFEVLVEVGAEVKAGAPLVFFDLEVLAQIAKSLVVPVIVTNGDEFELFPVVTGREIAAGDPVLRLGAPGEGGAKLEEPVSPPPRAAPAVGTIRRTAVLSDPHGIHARPAGVIAAVAKGSGDQVTLLCGERTANASSPVALMLLGAQCGDTITIDCSGPNATATADRLAGLLAGGDGAPAAAAPAAGPQASPAAAPASGATVSAPVAAEPLAPGASLDFDGVTAAPGLVTGVSKRVENEAFDIVEAGKGIEYEGEAFHNALQQTVARLEAAIAKSERMVSPQAEILGAHLAFVTDRDLELATDGLIRDGKSAAFAWKTAIDHQVQALRQLGNSVLAERAADLEDVCRQVLLVLFGRTEKRHDFAPGSILFADDLLPSQFADLDLAHIAGIALAGGGPTSHVAILAASKGIPAVVAAGASALRVPDGQKVVLDADRARIRINPPAADFEALSRTVEQRQARAIADRGASHTDCRMADGTRIEVVANLGGLADVPAALENGAEGCGLLRSEFLFLNRASAPTEDEQFEQYQAIARALGGRPLIVRTLDAGADKDVPYVGLPTEENPALGLRGVRTSLWQPDLLRAQVRAILRIEPIGQARILLPMVATVEDLRTVRAVITEEEKALGRTTPIEVGIMIEVPSAALIAGQLAAEADFFSVGTNDLTQYTLAMDRMSPRLARQLDAFHPAVLKLIAQAVEGSAAHGRWVGVCGSLASRPIAAPLLVGLGVRELSATAGTIAAIKALVRSLDFEHCARVAGEALKLESGEAVRALLAEHWPEV